MRNPVGAHEIEPARSTTEGIEPTKHRLGHEVSVVTRNVVGTLAVDIDAHARFVRDLCDDVVIKCERDTEGIEARADVGRGGRHPHPGGSGTEHRTTAGRGAHTSPSATAAVCASTGTTVGFGAPAMAHSGSLRPCPVTVQTTR